MINRDDKSLKGNIQSQTDQDQDRIEVEKDDNSLKEIMNMKFKERLIVVLME